MIMKMDNAFLAEARKEQREAIAAAREVDSQKKGSRRG